jgi:hypothetical protein
MLYTPVPGTPLFTQMQREGRMLDDVNLADIHGQFKFNYKHAAISRDQSKVFLDWAFRHDLERNGPSLFRICETIFQGWKRYHSDPDLRVRRRFAAEAQKLRTTYNAALWAMEKRLRSTNPSVSKRIGELRREVESAFGTFTRLIRTVVGPVLLWTSKREDRRLANGVTYEPKTFVERRNWLAKSHSADVVAMRPRDTKQPLTGIAVAQVAVSSLSQLNSGKSVGLGTT